MDWLTLVISNAVTLVSSLGGTILYFRPKLKEANASAIKAQAESQNYVYDSLMQRINSMEKVYNEQYESQNKVISELRKEVLRLGKEKFDSDKRIIQLEGENSELRKRVDGLEKELQSYKSLNP